MNIGEMQRKLSSWAEQDKERRFYGLYDLICSKDWLQRPVDANRLENLQTLCVKCHKIKTESQR
jgi:5-methylcytosine-specific restriction endonuclease McrA